MKEYLGKNYKILKSMFLNEETQVLVLSSL